MKKPTLFPHLRGLVWVLTRKTMKTRGFLEPHDEATPLDAAVQLGRSRSITAVMEPNEFAVLLVRVGTSGLTTVTDTTTAVTAG